MVHFSFYQHKQGVGERYYTFSFHELVQADLRHQWPQVHQVQLHCEEIEAQKWEKFAPSSTAAWW